MPLGSDQNIAAGVNVSDFSVEFLKLKSKTEVEVYARETLEEGIVEDGKILKKKKLAVKLKNLFDQAGYKPESVVCSLPESKVFINYFEFENQLEGDELKQAVDDKAGKTIPIESDKVCWDYIVFDKGDQKKVLYVGVLEEIVKDYVDIFQDLGIRLKSVDLESISLARLVEWEGEAGMIVDLGFRRTNISAFMKGGSLALSASSNIAGDRLTKSVQEKLGSSYEEAEKIKKEEGIISSEPEVEQALTDKLDGIIKEIKEAKKNFERKFGQKISKIMLTGGTVLLPGLQDYFEKGLSEKVKFMDPGKELSREGFLRDETERVFFSTVYGLALRDLYTTEKTLNFLERFDQERKRDKGKRVKKGVKLRPDRLEKFDYTVSLPTYLETWLFALPFFLVGLAIFLAVFYQYIFMNAQRGTISGASCISKKQRSKKISTTTTPTTTPKNATSSTEANSTSTSESKEGQNKQVRIINVEELNVRKGPGISYEKIATVSSDKSYTLLKEENDWYKIELAEGQIGWVSADYTQPVED